MSRLPLYAALALGMAAGGASIGLAAGQVADGPRLLLVGYLEQPDGLHRYVLDSHLSADDCAAALVAGVSAIPMPDGSRLDMSRAAIACELDTGGDF